MIQNNNIEYLYIHVPFCHTICAYCDFAHRVYQEEVANQWLVALQEEIQQTKIYPKLKTIYIGGGTPTSLSISQLEQLLALLDPYRGDVQEYTIEINPETFNEEKAILLRRHGINRVSLGFQSSKPELLSLMGRHHDLNMIQTTMNLLRKVQIDNISLDLMYSLPGQKMSDLKQSVKDAISTSPKHLSLYSLTIEPNTVFAKRGYNHLSDDEEADMYEWICQTLPKYGYNQYEISNFALDGYESIHNKAYWNYRDFYGISCGASGKDGYRRYNHTKDLQAYMNAPTKIENIPLTKKDAMFEMVMMGLRLKKGLSLALFQNTFQISVNEVYSQVINEEIQKGLLEMDEQYLRATTRGFEILNSILVDFM